MVSLLFCFQSIVNRQLYCYLHIEDVFLISQQLLVFYFMAILLMKLSCIYKSFIVVFNLCIILRWAMRPTPFCVLEHLLVFRSSKSLQTLSEHLCVPLVWANTCQVDYLVHIEMRFKFTMSLIRPWLNIPVGSYLLTGI